MYTQKRYKLENGPIVDYAGYSKKGHAPHNTRKPNQDGIIMANDDATNTLVLCVLDGHGPEGHDVSAAFSSRLATAMFEHDEWASDMKKACKQAISTIEQDLLENENIETEFSGTTLSMALIRDNVVTGVNIGDSRIVLAQQLNENGPLLPVAITNDHKPEDPKERERILAAGGRVFPVRYDDGVVGPDRVWLKHMDAPGLAMSRYVHAYQMQILVLYGVALNRELEIIQLSAHTLFVFAFTDLWEMRLAIEQA